MELVAKMEDKIHSYDAACTNLVVQGTALILQMEERIMACEVAYSEVAKKMEECKSSLKDQESVRFMPWVLS